MTLLEQFIAQHRRIGVVLDTNISLLYFVARFDREFVRQCKRTTMFIPDDYNLLMRLLSFFPITVVTPHLLTEACNLLGQVTEPARSGILRAVASVVPSLKEVYTPSERLMDSESFLRFELADAAILDLCAAGYGVVTDDMTFAGEVWKRGWGAVNFNHLRDAAWQRS